jgi:diacylglycerol kinase family enzyme
MSDQHLEHRLRHVAVVLNAKAGALVTTQDDGTAALASLFEAAGLHASFIGDSAGDLPARITAALANNPDAVVVAGGDGTIACAAQIMHGKTEIPLGILPFGTANLLAKDLRLPIGDPQAAIAAIARAKPRTIDVAEVNGHVFLCAAMLGMPTHLGRHREEARGARLQFLRRLPSATLRHILRPHTLRADLTISAQTIRIRAAAATITVNPMAEATGPRFARATLDGGTLVLYEIRARGLRAWAGFIGRVLTGRWRQDPALREYTAPTMRLDRSGQAATHVMLDGELRLLESPLAFTCHKRALTVLVG